MPLRKAINLIEQLEKIITMKKIILFAMAFSLSAYFGFAQNKKASGSSTQSTASVAKPEASENTDADNFMNRYYKIRDSYKNLPELYGKFSSSSYDMDEFMKRYYAFKGSYGTMPELAPYYAGSKNDMTEFI